MQPLINFTNEIVYIFYFKLLLNIHKILGQCTQTNCNLSLIQVVHPRSNPIETLITKLNIKGESRELNERWNSYSQVT